MDIAKKVITITHACAFHFSLAWLFIFFSVLYPSWDNTLCIGLEVYSFYAVSGNSMCSISCSLVTMCTALSKLVANKGLIPGTILDYAQLSIILLTNI